MDDAEKKLERLIEQLHEPVIAIDGRSAAGKTTLAAYLAGKYGFGVVHMDDFFLPFEMRTAERLSQAGGNVHRERFIEEVLPYLRNSFEYRPFDCSNGSYKPPVSIATGGVIVEGAYCMHPEFGRYYDIGVFMDITPEAQKERIIRRSGKEKWRQFSEKWIPFEEHYHRTYNVRAECGIVFKAE